MEETTYIFGPGIKSEVELARLIDQSRFYGEGMGDIIPPSVDPGSLQSILDIGSGSGDWCLDVAQFLPCKVIGIDLLRPMVEYANARAQSCNVSNVSFQLMDALKPLAFSDTSFDLVNSRFSASFIPTHKWPMLFLEWKRILRPGGTVCVTETDLGITNSMAWGQLLRWTAELGHQRGLNFGKGFSVGTVAMLGRFFQDAGFEHIQFFPYFLDASSGTRFHEKWTQASPTFGYQIRPMVIQQSNISEEHFDAVFHQTQEDMRSDDFRISMFLLSAVGVTPKVQ